MKVDNRAEYCYMVAWCEDRGMGTPRRSGLMKYPVEIWIDRERKLAGWVEGAGTASGCVSFTEFHAHDAKSDAPERDEEDRVVESPSLRPYCAQIEGRCRHNSMGRCYINCSCKWKKQNTEPTLSFVPERDLNG